MLYVEDEKEIREYLSAFLQKWVGELFIADNGEEGERLFHEKEPNLVLTDIRMPSMDGLDLASRIKEVQPRVPVIILSAYKDSEYLMRGIESGVDRFIVKPVDYSDILEALDYYGRFIYREKEVEEQRTLLEQYRSIIDDTAIVSKTDTGGKITYANNRFCQISGFTREELMNKPHSIIRHPDMPSEVYRDLWATILNGHSWQGILKNKKKDGGVYYVDTNIRPIFTSTGEIQEFISVRYDVTELIESREKLKEKQMHLEYEVSFDSLTGIYNRKSLNDLASREIEKANRYDSDLSLIMMDLDHFKNINDSLGHMTGDNVLRRSAEITTLNLRATDVFCRWGGEEFVILCPETSYEQAKTLAERIRIGFEKSDFFINRTVTCSLGVCEYEKGDDLDQMIEKADRALYEAKKTRNSVS